jgi:hypothetical protein
MFADMGMAHLSKKQVQIFERVLTDKLETLYEEHIASHPRGCYVLYCDYGPDLVLAESAKVAGIPMLNFPFKTGMRILKDRVEVSNGYGQPFVDI